MFADTRAYSGFAVDDLGKARQFYGETLGIKTSVMSQENGLMSLDLAGDRTTLVYVKADFTPATYTILNIPTDDINSAVADLKNKGVRFERYEGMTGDDDIAHGLASGMGPDIAWFKDPAGNILSVLQDA